MIVVMLIAFGLCLGSFVEATSWRLHQQSLVKKRSTKEQKSLSITKGRSMCASCKHALAWYDLVPLLSWLSLAGKCRYCRKSIGWHAPLLELSTAALFVFSYLKWPYPLALTTEFSWLLFAVWLVILVGFVLLAIYDLRWMLLPDKVVYPLQVIALLYAFIALYALHLGFDGITQPALAVLVIAGLFWCFYQFSKGTWIGGGDVKLAVVLGLVVGTPLNAGLVLFLSSLFGTLVGVPAMIWSKEGSKAKIPFGPFLITATIIVVLFGSSLVDWYTRHFIAF